MFFCVQQRACTDNRADKADDIRNNWKLKLRIYNKSNPWIKCCNDPRFNTYFDFFQLDIWPFIRSYFQTDTKHHSRLHTRHPTTVNSKLCDRSRQWDSANTQTDANQETSYEISFCGSEFTRRGGEHEICPGPIELGGRNAGSNLYRNSLLLVITFIPCRSWLIFPSCL